MAPRQVALLALLAAIWGASYLLIKYALEDLSAPAIVFGRCALAAAVLALALRATGGREAPRAALRDLRARPRTALLLGATAVAAPFTLITLGELEVPSGLAAVLISPASLFVALLAPLVDVTERPDRRQAVGMLMGFGGVALVVGVESIHSLGAFVGALAMVGAAFFYGVSSFVVKGSYRGLSPVQTSFVSVLVASGLTLPAALATLPAELPGPRAALSVLALGAVGTALAFVIFYRLIGEVGAGRASLVSYLAPGVALVYGAALLDERVTPTAVLGLVAILAGVALASRPRAVARAAEAPAGAAARHEGGGAPGGPVRST